MLRIVLIGAGNVGTHLALRLRECNVPVCQVYSRRLPKAQKLAQQIGAQATNQWATIQTNAELYILAVSDDAIPETAAQLGRQLPTTALVVHTSGSTPSSVLQDFNRHGVFYPLQTFSVDQTVDFSTIPICISAKRSEDEILLEKLGQLISQKIYRINDQKRAVLHVAAVFANNFANHCFQISYEILHNEQLPFDLLEPLIQETANKVIGKIPADMQTGPGIRGDVETIQRHLDYLKKMNSPYQEIYTRLSKSIHPTLELKD